jgi:hypothetical protein
MWERFQGGDLYRSMEIASIFRELVLIDPVLYQEFYKSGISAGVNFDLSSGLIWIGSEIGLDFVTGVFRDEVRFDAVEYSMVFFLSFDDNRTVRGRLGLVLVYGVGVPDLVVTFL